MAFFKFRKGGDDQTVPAAQPESVEVLRRRAKNRLIGSAILVLIGVIGFPLLVDKQPRPVAVDLPIEIPDKNKVLPLAVPPAPPAPVAAVPEVPVPSAAASGVVTQAAPPAAEKSGAKPEPKPVTKPEVKAEVKKPEPRPAADGRYVVQIGSFADEGRARDARAKLERAGLKNYTQAVETKDGKRIRVRAGPFASKAEAERAADKIKKLDLPGTVLSL
jgi:DedD protein